MTEPPDVRDRLLEASSEPAFLLLIAPVLPLELIEQAIHAASRLGDPLLRVRTVAALIRRLPADARQELAERLTEEAADVPHRQRRDAALRSLAAELASSDPDFALAVTDRIAHDYRRAQARGAVAITLIQGGDTARAEQLVGNLPFESVRSRAYTTAAKVCAANGDRPGAEAYLQLARSLADTIERPWRREAALRNVAAAERRLSTGSVRSPTTLAQAAGRTPSPPQLRQTLRAIQRLPAGVQRGLFAEALGRLMPMSLANGGPPTDSPLEAHRRMPPRRRPVVNTGFAITDPDRTSIDRFMPLTAGEACYFWLNLGEPLAESIAARPTPLDVDHLPAGARLKVVVFGFASELELTRGAETGELELQIDGSGVVARQPGTKDVRTPADRLYFPIRAPARPGVSRLRCSIYHGQVLLQSWLVQAMVVRTPGARRARPAQRAAVDYSLIRQLQPATLERVVEPHKLSLMLNDNGGGSIGFRFVGAGEFLANVDLDADQLQNFIDMARRGLRKVSWGSEGLWDGRNAADYRYQPSPPPDDARADLASLAVRGYRIYNELANAPAVSQGDQAVKDLEQLMRQPGGIQVALKRSPRHLFPAGIVYDYPLNTNAFGANVSRFELCPDFLAARQQPAPLEDSPCFHGQCPTRGKVTAICPSGFWGFRHQIGFPVSLGRAADATAEIPCDALIDLSVCTSTDRGFTLRAGHLDALRTLRSDIRWQLAETQGAVLENLSRSAPDLVYFYCHGGITADKLPFIQVGDPEDPNEFGITPDNLRAFGIEWRRPQPLVFINGCHTTALEPEAAINFVSELMIKSRAAGVIGTEITVFEPLAGTFAIEFLRRFMDGVPLGEAVRSTRLALLKVGNPLGLVYVPYALANLRLVRATN